MACHSRTATRSRGAAASERPHGTVARLASVWSEPARLPRAAFARTRDRDRSAGGPTDQPEERVVPCRVLPLLVLAGSAAARHRREAASNSWVRADPRLRPLVA